MAVHSVLAHDKRGIRHYRGSYETLEDARARAREVLFEEPNMTRIAISGDVVFSVRETITREEKT